MCCSNASGTSISSPIPRRKYHVGTTIREAARNIRDVDGSASDLNPWMGRQTMAPKKRIATKRRAWNKGLEVGKRDAFTPAQVKRIRALLTDRGVPGLRDLALFSTAIDTMLRAQDLL